MAKKNKVDELPKLPFGMGTMIWKDKSHTIIQYRKSIESEDKTVRKRITVQGKTIADVTNKMKEAEKNFIKNEKIISNKNNKTKQVLSKAMNEWIELYKRPVLKSTSFDRIKSTYINSIVGSTLGNQYVSTITSDDIQNFLQNIQSKKRCNDPVKKEQISFSSRKKIYGLLSQFFAYWYKLDERNNPMVFVPKLKKEEKSINVKDIDKNIEEREEFIILNDEEMQCFEKEATTILEDGTRKYEYGDIIAFLMWSFIRVGELLALTWDNVDFENKKLSITQNLIRAKNYETDKFDLFITTPKSTSSIRKIDLTNKSCELLKRYKDFKKPLTDKEYIMFDVKKQKIQSYYTVYRIFNNILNNSGIEKNITVHGLRHTGISYFLRHGVPVEVVSRMAGHSTIAITQNIYYSVIPQQKSYAIDTLNNIIDN